jgi:NCAIR mutase (PurE)-related protein
MRIISLLLAAPFVLAQAPADQDKQLQTGLADVSAIDDELASITKSQAELTKSRAARLDEITSLRTRYPEISLADTSSPAEIYRALFAVRTARAKLVMPIVEQKKRIAEAQYCEARSGLIAKRAEMEASGAYKRLTLAERLELRRNFDAVIDDQSVAKCPDPIPLPQ